MVCYAKENTVKFYFNIKPNRIIITILILARRLTESEKQQIVSDFTNGKSIDDLSLIFKFSKLTITRNLKKNLEKRNLRNF